MDRRKFLGTVAGGFGIGVISAVAPEWVLASEPRSRFTLHVHDDEMLVEVDVDGQMFIDWVQAHRLIGSPDEPWVTAVRWREHDGDWQLSKMDVIENGELRESVLAPVKNSRPEDGPTSDQWGTEFFGFQQVHNWR